MAWIQTSDDDPLFHVGGKPFRVTETLVASLVGAWVFLALGSALGVVGSWISLFTLSPASVLRHGWAWQLFTYPLIDDLQAWFVLYMAILFLFGRIVERSLGRGSYILLLVGLTVVPALAYCLGAFATGGAAPVYGSTTISFGLFIVFALLYPEAPTILFGLPVKWIAGGGVAAYSLIYVAKHAWAALAMLWASLAVAFLITRFRSVGEWLNDLREKQERAKAERERAKAAAVVAQKKAAEARRNQSIDPILEKISKSGMQSLTGEERAVLEEARKELLRRDGSK